MSINNIEILKNGKNSKRIDAARQLAHSKDKKALTALVNAAINDNSLNVRKEVCLALGYHDVPYSGIALEKKLRDESEKVRWNAAFSLRRMNSYTALDYMKEVAQDNDHEKWCLALQCINSNNFKYYEPYLKLALDKKDGFIVSTALNVIIKNKEKVSEKFLKKFIGSEDPAIRETAYAALLEIPEQKQQTLSMMKKDPDKEIRKKAETLTNKSTIKKTYDPVLEDKFIGCIVGAAIGDALGCPIEALTYNSIIRDFGYVTSYMPNTNRRGDKMGLGEWTDDTEMALAIANALIDERIINPQHLGELFAQDIEEIDLWQKIERGYSKKSLIISKMLRLGVNWRYSGLDRIGCGSVMRTHPIGAFSHDDIDELIENSKLQTLVTHKGSESIDSTILLSYAVAKAFAYDQQKNPLNTELFYNDIKKLGSKLIPILTEKLEQYRKYQEIGIPEFVILTKSGRGPVDTACLSIECFLRSPNDFLRAVTMSINNDGDSDSTGSMTGAISGAYLGFSKIPKDLVSGLHQKDMLIEKGKRLYQAYREK